MKFPKLKHALFCRILTYVVVLGGFLVPIVAVCCVDFLPDPVKVAIVFALIVGLLAYLLKNFPVLMGMDIALAMLHCNLSARKRYDLPRSRTQEKIEKRISRFGMACDPTPYRPQPLHLRYRLSTSATYYTRGIEKVIAAYETDCLDAEQYHAIFRSAKANSKALTGRREPRLLDKEQKDAPLNRVTVCVIFARRTEQTLWEGLYKKVCQQGGDEWEDAIIPCVIDLEKGQCVFNSECLPYAGFAYPVKNRGIRLVKKLVFGGRISTKGNPHYLEPMAHILTEVTLWEFWRKCADELKDTEKEMKKQMTSMTDGQILREDDLLYVKWGEKAVCLTVAEDKQQRKAVVEPVTHWSYPKSNPIGKKTIGEIELAITRHFSNQGYGVTFEEMDE